MKYLISVILHKKGLKTQHGIHGFKFDWEYDMHWDTDRSQSGVRTVKSPQAFSTTYRCKYRIYKETHQ